MSKVSVVVIFFFTSQYTKANTASTKKATVTLKRVTVTRCEWWSWEGGGTVFIFIGKKMKKISRFFSQSSLNILGCKNKRNEYFAHIVAMDASVPVSVDAMAIRVCRIHTFVSPFRNRRVACGVCQYARSHGGHLPLPERKIGNNPGDESSDVEDARGSR
jgi:hypothetical protein